MRRTAEKQEEAVKKSLIKKISENEWYKNSYPKAINRIGLMLSFVTIIYFVYKEIFGTGLNIGFWSYDNSILNFQDSINSWLSPLCLSAAIIFYFFVLFRFIIPSLINLPIIPGVIIGLIVGSINSSILSQYIEYYPFILVHFCGLFVAIGTIIFIYMLKFGPPLTGLGFSVFFGAVTFSLTNPIVYEVEHFNEFTEPTSTFGGGMVAGMLTSIFISIASFLLLGLYEGIKKFLKNLQQTKKDGDRVIHHKIISLFIFLGGKIKKFFMWLLGA